MADLDEISMLLGEIKSDIKHIQGDVKQVLVWQEGHEEADQHRFKELADRITVNNGYRFRIEALEDTAELHKPVIEHVKRLRWAAAVFGTIIVTLAGIAPSAWALAKDWLF